MRARPKIKLKDTTASIDIRELRKQLELPRPEFARLLGIDMRTLIRWETGETAPTGAAEAVLTALLVVVRQDWDGSTIPELQEIARLGGLPYLIIRLFDYWQRSK